MCREAFKIGKSATVAINAANEIAVEKFLNYKIKFTDIPTFAEKAISKFGNNNILSIDDIFDIDREVREYILSM